MSDRECSAFGCAHVHDLQCALMSITSGGLQRTRYHRRRLPGGGEVIDEAFDERPGLWEELQTTIARLSKTGGSSAGAGKTSETPIPYHERASAVAHRMRNELSTWARVFAEDHPHLTLPADSPPAIARWLAMFPSLLAESFTPELATAVRAVVRDAERVIDHAPDRIFVGRCETPSTEEGRETVKVDPTADVPRCMADLYVRVEQPKAAKGGDDEARTKPVVSCRECAAIHDVAYRKTWLAQHLSGSLVTAGDAAPYLSYLTGKDIKVDTIHKWKRGGRLQSRDDRDGRPLYRFRDLLALAEEVRTRNTGPRSKEGSVA